MLPLSLSCYLVAVIPTLSDVTASVQYSHIVYFIFIDKCGSFYSRYNLSVLRFLLTTIKDTWTKPRGRVEVGEGGGFSWGGVEGWGEKAYNCN